MATTSLYLLPSSNGSPAKFTSVAPAGGTVIFPRGYGDINDLDTVIQMLQGMLPELAAMKDQPCAIRIDLVTP